MNLNVEPAEKSVNWNCRLHQISNGRTVNYAMVLLSVLYRKQVLLLLVRDFRAKKTGLIKGVKL